MIAVRAEVAAHTPLHAIGERVGIPRCETYSPEDKRSFSIWGSCAFPSLPAAGPASGLPWPVAWQRQAKP
jgi:hypothetical protein